MLPPVSYIRDLARRDYEREEQRKWVRLRQELKAGAEAPEADFVPLDADNLIAEAKASRCQELLSEDLNHGQDYDGVVVVNPFGASTT
jgi:predicted nucleic acid-binding protein